MINLAGNKDTDSHIREELYLADIPRIPFNPGNSEVPYTIIGKLEGWTFERAWYYYVATCLDNLGLPYDVAVELHKKTYPILDKKYDTLGQAVRVDGHCGCLHPKEFKYPSLEDIEAEFVEAKKKFLLGTNFDLVRTFNTSALRELKGTKYIRRYHIDSIVGLKEFADTIKKIVWEERFGTE